MLSWLALFTMWQGDLNALPSLYEECLAIFRELGDITGVADTLGELGMYSQMIGDFEQSNVLLEESSRLWHELGNTGGSTMSLFFLGTLSYSKGDIAQAGDLFEQGLTQFRTMDAKWMIAELLVHVATVQIDHGEFALANQNLMESLRLLQELHEKWSIFHAFEVFAYLAATKKPPNLIRSARIFGAAAMLREIYSSPRLPMHHNLYERSIMKLRAQLDQTALEKAWAEGRAMTFDHVVAYALNEAD